jgi:cell division protein FtsQ
MEPPPRRRRWLRLLVVLLVLTLLAGCGWLVAFSSVLATRRVEVTGVKILTAGEVRSAAQVPLGTPLARQDIDGIAVRVAGLLPVSSVEVRRKWPTTLAVTVQERKPLLAVRQATGFQLVDDTGVSFLAVPAVPDGVVLTDVDPTDGALLTQVGMVAAAMPEKLQDKVDKIQASSRDGIRLALKDGDVVTWGSADDSALKSSVLLALLKQRARSYDVSAPHSPAFR